VDLLSATLYVGHPPAPRSEERDAFVARGATFVQPSVGPVPATGTKAQVHASVVEWVAVDMVNLLSGSGVEDDPVHKDLAVMLAGMGGVAP
jgi:hypothetical protein